MMEKFIEILSNSAADAWEITDDKIKAWEFYFIGHRLDQHRVRAVAHITLKAF